MVFFGLCCIGLGSFIMLNVGFGICEFGLIEFLFMLLWFNVNGRGVVFEIFKMDFFEMFCLCWGLYGDLVLDVGGIIVDDKDLFWFLIVVNDVWCVWNVFGSCVWLFEFIFFYLLIDVLLVDV